MPEQLTKQQQAQADVAALLRAKNTGILIVTQEEARLEAALLEVGSMLKSMVVFWDADVGLVDATWKQLPGADPTTADPNAMMSFVLNTSLRALYVLRDSWWLQDPTMQRRLINLVRRLERAPKEEARAVIVLTPRSDVPLELRSHLTVIEWPLPERVDIARNLDWLVSKQAPEIAAGAIESPEARDAVIDAASGLFLKAATDFFAKSLVRSKRIDPKLVVVEKKRLIAGTPGLSWMEPEPRGLKAMGGNEELIRWVVEHKAALGQDAREFGVPELRGVFLAGVPGSGKSYAAKIIPTVWGLPLLRLDPGGFKSKYVGESEQQFRQGLQMAEAMAPCVVLIDEIEKGFGGASGPQGDGGVSSYFLGSFLSWMQDHTGTVFVVATANDVRSLPPELMRKGRFDEVWWLDLPTLRERAAILCVTLEKFGRELPPEDLRRVAAVARDFTGSEIAALVTQAMFESFRDGRRPIVLSDLLRAAEMTTPLARTAPEKINELREWAKGKARRASVPDAVEPSAERALEL